ncbi:MAG TPA: hypothetical protein DHI91_00040 [Candidatus Portnoybacteria bacterium]|nr:hypothetical protein [Candidatus Portnoybacteria bacterium]
MSEQILEHLFDSPVKVKIYKLFLRNAGKYFSLPEIAKKTQSNSRVVKRQVNGLLSISFLRRKKVKASRKKGIKGGIYFSVNTQFDFFNELNNLILKSSPTSKEKMLRRIMKLGRIKMALISGVFLNTDNSRVDLFLVGDDISERKLRKFLSDMEAEVGREIVYAALTSKEFDYRFHMFDRFVRDILEKPHEKMINRIKFID